VDEGLENGVCGHQVRAFCLIPPPSGPGGATPVHGAWSATVYAQISSVACLGAPTVVLSSVNPALLWPPNGKIVPVTVEGSVSPGPGCPMPSQVNFELVGEYASFSTSGSADVVDGLFSFAGDVQASRLGHDLDGRTYEIHVNAYAEGYEGYVSDVVSGEVLVPHDQRKR
jgi:hypothetical protein